MTLPDHQQQQQQGEGLLTSWRKNNSTPGKRHASAPPPHQRTPTCTVPDAPKTSMFHPHEDHSESTATTPSASTPIPTRALDGDSAGPLSFPAPKFSAALKVVEDDTFTLVSQATGRRWMAVDSCRECQFGEVLRAMELTGETAAPPAYFAIKVGLHASSEGDHTAYACLDPATTSLAFLFLLLCAEGATWRGVW